jgi:hypothetical protein
MASNHLIGCACCNYIQARVCSGGAGGTPRDIWVKKSGVPAGCTYFQNNSWCYSICKDWAVAAPPPTAYILQSIGGSFTSCNNCKASSSSAGSSSSCDHQADPDHCPNGCGDEIYCDCVEGVGCGGGGGSGGGGSGIYGHNCKGFPANMCEGGNTTQEGILWVCKGRGDPSGRFYFRFYNDCWYVDIGSGAGTEAPVQAVTLVIDGSYDDCEDCLGGTPCFVCAGQELPDNVPNLWVRHRDLPANPVFFRFNNICYGLDPNNGSYTIPPNVTLIHPHNEYNNCTDCVTGVSAELCPDPNRADGQQEGWENAPQIWVYSVNLPEHTIYFKYGAFCYSLNPNDPATPKPADAIVFNPRAEYASCGTCLCGERLQLEGVKAHLCSGQHGTISAEEIWIPDDALPDDTIYFQYYGLCYYLDPTGEVARIPIGALLYFGESQFDNCNDCVRQEESSSSLSSSSGDSSSSGTSSSSSGTSSSSSGTSSSSTGGGGSSSSNGHNCPPGYIWIDGFGCVPLNNSSSSGHHSSSSSCLCKRECPGSLRTHRCDDHNAAGPNVKCYGSGLVGKVVKIGNDCYNVTFLKDAANSDELPQAWPDCSSCDNASKVIQYTLCAGGDRRR